jgi:hypothetical protein
MENKGLLFIPDISGFTKFVNETEINHSRQIIQELLEVLINANKINLEISEIEGDAILFFKYGSCPSLKDIYKQVEQMFCEFHKYLVSYNLSRFCQCEACVSALNLSLKVVTHYGEFTSYNIKNFSKLIGKDVIVAHQLLKNDIDHHEYWLVTMNLIKDNPNLNFKEWMEWNSSAKKTESGEIPFQYTQLGELKNTIEPHPIPKVNLNEKARMFTLTEDFDVDIITLVHSIGDFNYKHRWLEGVKNVKEVSHFLPRLGTKCVCEMENGEIITYTATGYVFAADRIEFTETEDKRDYTKHFVLEKLDHKKTRLSWSFYIRKNLFEELMFNLLHKNAMEQSFRRSLVKLHQLVKEIKLPPKVEEPA